jgi:hypothetical protein
LGETLSQTRSFLIVQQQPTKISASADVPVFALCHRPCFIFFFKAQIEPVGLFFYRSMNEKYVLPARLFPLQSIPSFQREQTLRLRWKETWTPIAMGTPFKDKFAAFGKGGKELKRWSQRSKQSWRGSAFL